MTVSDLNPYNFTGRGVTQEIDGNLRLRSSAAGQGNLTVDGTTTLTGAQTLTGNSTLSGNLAVTGTSALTGAVTASSTLAVTGASTLTGAVSANGGLAVSGGTGLTGSKAWLYQYLEPTGTLASTQDGRGSASATAAAVASGTVYVFAIPLESGITITNINLFVLTAEAGGTHNWVGIADSTANHKILAISADQTGATYFGGANSAVTTALSSTYTTTSTGLYYLFVCAVQGTTAPTFAAAPAIVHANLSNVAPALCGTTLTAQTTPPAVASNLGAITATAGHNIYAWLT